MSSWHPKVREQAWSILPLTQQNANEALMSFRTMPSTFLMYLLVLSARVLMLLILILQMGTVESEW